jgi:hypothetical protein
MKNLVQEIEIGFLPNTSWEQCHLTCYSLPVTSTAENSEVHCTLITPRYISHYFHLRLGPDQGYIVNTGHTVSHEANLPFEMGHY